MTVKSGTTLQLPRAFDGKYPSKRHSKKEKRVIETADATARLKTNVTFMNPPVCVAAVGAGAAVGTDTAVNLMIADGCAFEYTNIGAQTILAPAFSAAGLDIARDLTNNEGTEITLGTTARAKHAYTVGTTGSFYFQVSAYLTDVSGSDQFLIGFRKAEAYQADWNNYDELAAVNIVGGNISVSTILNNAATATVDSTLDWVDATAKTIRVEVNRAGHAKFFVDNVQIGPMFKFDAGEVVLPFITLIHDTDVAEATLLTSVQCGLIGH